MYCSSCGVAVAQGLTYCKNCGAKLIREDIVGQSSEGRADLLVPSIVVTFLFGLVGITILMGVMKSVLGLSVEVVLAILTLPFALMLTLEAVFIRLLFRRDRRSDQKDEAAQPEEHATNELNPAQARSLTEGRPSSVTEHTTRAFDPIYTERK